MKTFELTDEEFETLKDIFSDHGSDCPYVDCGQFQALGEKFGILEPIPPPTEEELKRREAWKNDPLNIIVQEMFKSANVYAANGFIKQIEDNTFMSGEQWGDKIGTTIKIRLPNDHTVGK